MSNPDTDKSKIEMEVLRIISKIGKMGVPLEDLCTVAKMFILLDETAGEAMKPLVAAINEYAKFRGWPIIAARSVRLGSAIMSELKTEMPEGPEQAIAVAAAAAGSDREARSFALSDVGDLLANLESEGSNDVGQDKPE